MPTELFKEGNPGRLPGSVNKLTKSVKETVLKVFNELQGDPKHNLQAFAKKHPKEFYIIASKLIPTEMIGTGVMRFIISPMKKGVMQPETQEETISENGG